MNKQTSLRRLTETGVIAALYVALTLLVAPLSYGAVQVRVSELLTVLPVFTAAAVPGLTVGCLLANLLGMSAGLTGGWDVLFGTAATLLASMLTYRLRNVRVKNLPVLSALMPVVCNAVIVGLELALFFSASAFTAELYAVTALWVGLDELLSAFVGGLLLFLALRKTKLF
ncbi:MAG: QueT transporter family protein [Clostridia bacterium]|nr:QueT transporter family protein [Clostridia bacterium]